MSSDYDIEMSTDDTLELDAIISDWSNPDTVVDLNGSDFNMSGFQTSTAVLDPQSPGKYTIKVNGQELTINVSDASTIPDENLVHQYDATALSGSDGDSISTWGDQEGEDDLTQTTTDAQPTLKTGQIGGNQVLRFDGSDDLLDVDWSDLSQPIIIFIVSELLTESVGHLFDSFSGDSITFNISGNDGDYDFYAGSVLNVGTPDLNAHLWTFTADGASSSVRQDKSAVVSGDAGAHGLNGLTVGAQKDATTHQNVDVGEILVYTANLSDSSRNDVESYLDNKWGSF